MSCFWDFFAGSPGQSPVDFGFLSDIQLAVETFEAAESEIAGGKMTLMTMVSWLKRNKLYRPGRGTPVFVCCKNLLVVLVAILLGACTVQYPGVIPVDSGRQKAEDKVVESLYAQFENWQGVPYQLGGLSKGGIDCSGFVYLTYKNHFGIELPRTTGQQAKTGQPVKGDVFQAGDLVFFKTGILVKHVGIYVENGEFLHASTANGVMLSRLSDPYWSSHYWKTVRIP